MTDLLEDGSCVGCGHVLCACEDCGRCGHHRDTHAGGDEVLGQCWVFECPCEGDDL
jgi:hypothetical protein